jgi:hypothetical protein
MVKKKVVKEVTSSVKGDLTTQQTLSPNSSTEPTVKPKKEIKTGIVKDGLVLGGVTTDKVDFKGDTIQHVLAVTETVATNLRKSGRLQVISTVVGDKVISQLVYV